jgi:hypothetical protein
MSERTIQQLVDRLNSSDPDFDDCTDAAIILLRQYAEIERLTAERDSAEKCCSMLSRINNGIILAMQAAWIAHQYGKEPADIVMEWIANSPMRKSLSAQMTESSMLRKSARTATQTFRMVVAGCLRMIMIACGENHDRSHSA